MASFRIAPPRLILWDVAWVLGGLLLIGTTFRAYRFFEPVGNSGNHIAYSPAEADRHIESDTSYLSSHPDSYSALTDLAIAYFQKGPEAYVDALNTLEKARAAGATDESLFYYAGVMYDVLNLPDYAINELSKYLRHHPEDYETLVRLGNLSDRENKYEDASMYYQHALKLWPKDPTVWFNLAIANKDKGNLDEALSDLQQVMKLAGRLPEGGSYQQGEIYRLKGFDDPAIQSYQQELAARPDDVPALTGLMTVLKKKGNFKEARGVQKHISDLKAARTPEVAPALGPPATP